MDPQSGTSATSTWPGAFGIYKQAKAATVKNWKPILLLMFISIVLSAFVDNNNSDGNTSPWYLVLVVYLVSFCIQFGLYRLYLAGVKDTTLSFVDALREGGRRYLNGFITVILTALLVMLSILALVIPFFFVAPRLALALYFVFDKDMGPWEAIKASWNTTKGNYGKIYGVIGVTILFVLAVLVVVGLYFSFMYQTAFAVLYRHLTGGEVAADPTSLETPAATA